MAPTAPTRVLGWLQRAGLTLLFVLAIVFGAVVGILLAYETDLPQVSSLEDFQPNIITQVYAADGSLLGEFAIERRVVVGFKDIPPVLRNAVVAVEDADFWKHLGVNLWRIPCAALANLRSGRRSQGSSTLTMQLSRRAVPDPREDLRAQDQGGHPRLPDREELHQGRDLHPLLQPGVLRPRQLRGGGHQPVPLQQVRSRT